MRVWKGHSNSLSIYWNKQNIGSAFMQTRSDKIQRVKKAHCLFSGNGFQRKHYFYKQNYHAYIDANAIQLCFTVWLK